MEKLSITRKHVVATQKDIEQLLSLLDTRLEVLDELCIVYLENEEEKNREAAMDEAQSLESEIQAAIDKAHEAVKITGLDFCRVCFISFIQGTRHVSKFADRFAVHPTRLRLPPPPQSSHSHQVEAGISQSSPTGSPAKHRLNPLKMPSYGGDKPKFEEFWWRFESMVDQSKEPINLKIARLRQCLISSAQESIRGLGVSDPEQAKEILIAKFGGQWRQLRAYMDQLEKMPQLRNNGVQGFEKFANLVRIHVLKLTAKGRNGELGEGTLHSLLVNKLAGVQLLATGTGLGVICTKFKGLAQRGSTNSSQSYGDDAWLDCVTVKADGLQASHRNPNRHKSRSFHVGSEWLTRTRRSPGSGQSNRKPPCVCCGSLHHGVWVCTAFLQRSYEDQWQLAKDKGSCFWRLAGDHQGKNCMKSQTCQIDGCHGNHHRLLLGSLPVIDQPVESVQSVVDSNSYSSLAAREGAVNFAPSPEGEDIPVSRAMTTHNPRRLNEAYSLRTIPVSVKAQGKKVKVNATLDDASNESFLNEEVAGALELKEKLCR